MLEDNRTIALAGNPNVGKSTVFNRLTGMHQHTGNWPGKTVEYAEGKYRFGKTVYTLVDTPGMYSLLPSSEEERVAGAYICGGEWENMAVVVDGTCLERNLILVLQILEAVGKCVLCVNMIDEAKRKGINIDFERLSAMLQVPCVPVCAQKGQGLEEVKTQLAETMEQAPRFYQVANTPEIDQALEHLAGALADVPFPHMSRRVAALFLLAGQAAPQAWPDWDGEKEAIEAARKEAADMLEQAGVSPQDLMDLHSSKIAEQAAAIAKACVGAKKNGPHQGRLDRILTSRLTGIPIMLLLVGLLFWITMAGANYPSQWLSSLFAQLEGIFRGWLEAWGAAQWLTGLLIDGMFRTVSWVVSVMLPPMAIFFPLFTLLEDSGYLPRIAFNLDRVFHKAGAHGKQALTTCMGFGCNACGVVGCRIIDSPRERLIGILTNAFIPCNGRYPTLITLTLLFFCSGATGLGRQAASAGILVLIIGFAVGMSLLASKLLSKTLLKGEASSFLLELPPYRKPQIAKVLVRSLLSRTLFVLGRAIKVAAPAGLVIWTMANVEIGGASILHHCTGFLDPLGRAVGLDGVILMAFLLGWPANEIVIPLVIMGYTAGGTLTEAASTAELGLLLTQNGWTWVTAVCMVIFVVCHFPCGTTTLTIKKETGSLRWTLAAMALPTAAGLLLCFAVSSVAGLFG